MNLEGTQISISVNTDLTEFSITTEAFYWHMPIEGAEQLREAIDTTLRRARALAPLDAPEGLKMTGNVLAASEHSGVMIPTS